MGAIYGLKHKIVLERYYDLQNTYLIDHINQEIIKYPKEVTRPITGHLSSDFIKIYFNKPDTFLKSIETNNEATIEITKDSPFWKWRYTIPKDGPFENYSKQIWIHEDDMSISKMSASITEVKTKQEQYQEWDLSNLVYNQVSANDLQNRFQSILNKYKLKNYKKPPPISMIPNGESIPNISGQLYKNNQALSLADYKGNFLLLDLWYVGCPPCVESIPKLNQIQKKYASDGLVVLGANSIDNNKKGHERLKRFLDHTPVNFPILLAKEDEEFSKLEIRVYPSFYLIDKSGKIIHSGFGYSEQSSETLDSIINYNIKKATH